MYAITDKKNAQDIIAHEKMEGKNPEVYKKGDNYAVKVESKQPMCEIVNELGKGWVECPKLS